VSPTASLVAAGVAALALAGVHLVAPHVRRLPGVPERATGSLAGGVAVAYVFLHLLPELATGNEEVGTLLEDVVEPTPLFEMAVFVVALAGFTLYYGLERVAERSRTGGSGLAFRLHLGSFTVYSALIAYGLPLRFRTGVVFAVLFAVAMGLHFLLVDRGLEAHHRDRFERRGRVVLALAVLAGWGLAAVAAPTSTLAVSLATAFLAGAVLLTVFKEELPSGRRSSFRWFLVGVVLYSALLAATAALGG